MSHELSLDILERLTSRAFNKTHLPTIDLELELPQAPQALDIEIGCGVGMHPLGRAIHFPKRTIVAIEHTKEKFQKFARRIKAHQNPVNLIAVHANAISVLTHHIKDESVDQIFLLYPNPYPKISDRKKRWVFLPFMKELIAKLRSGGMVTIATNEAWYAEEVWMAMELAYPMTTRSIQRLDQNARPRTHFEAKYLARGEICLNMEFVKLSSH